LDYAQSGFGIIVSSYLFPVLKTMHFSMTHTGGDMFLRSAAPDTLQGKAIQEVNETWGALHMKKEEVDDILNRRRARGKGCKAGSDLYIGIPVCKKKYTPFNVKRTT
jgi:hypothetical protein